MNEKRKQSIPSPFQFDDFFKSQKEIDDDAKEKVEEIAISLIDNFKEHPFKVIENEELKALQESIKTNGVLSPVIVRENGNGRYEMISGHRRKLASELLGREKIPCIIKNLTDDEATIIMVDSNLQREKLLPSEKAFAYKMKYEAIKHQGKTFGPLVQRISSSGPLDRKSSAEILGEESGESEKTVRRYIRLTYLIPELLKMVDDNEIGNDLGIAIRPAVEISYLTSEEQKNVHKYISYYLSTPSQTQAIKMKELSKEGKLTESMIKEILESRKPNQIEHFTIKQEKLLEVIPKNVKKNQIEDYVLKACKYYAHHLKNKDMEGR